MQQYCSKYFARRHPTILGMGSIGQKSTFSEHGHVAYQTTGRSNMVATWLKLYRLVYLLLN